MYRFFLLPIVLLMIAGPVHAVDNSAQVQRVAVRAAPSGTIAHNVGSLLNRERQARNLPAISHSNTLSAVAQAHANDMARRNYFSHTGADGSTISRRIKRRGYRPCLSAENIAKGQRSPQEVMQAWMNSAGHRRNNLHHRVREYGVGYSGDGRYWVLVFARPGC
ncbi:CAP domain-containing protein [Aliiroseovarius sp. YM-037]|uniref:CAP domain-containing protein n=1 Tax=Aliiroseovarius sp. YM-037 TaxID=3341728 RepID=UPI003A8085D3